MTTVPDDLPERIAAHELDPADVARRARAVLARRSLAAFTRQAVAAGVVHGVSKLRWGPHLDAVCSQVQAQLEGWLVAYGRGTPDMVARQREAWERTGAAWEDGLPEPWLRYVLVQNALDNLPPGTLKSTIVMVLANAWIWLWEPRFAFGALSGIDANVDRDSRATRDLIRTAWYRETFEIAWSDVDGEVAFGVRTDIDSVSDWATTAGGKRISRTLTSGLTGQHVDGIFLDDPDDADKVWSEAERLKPQNRFTRAIENRVNDEHRTLRRVLQQRVHVEDFTAYLLSVLRWSPRTPKGWAQLCVPAEFGLGPEDAPPETPYGWKDWRTARGELMHDMLSAGVLADKRAKLPGYEGQYNQNPRRTGGGMFALRHARFFELEGMPLPQRRRPEGCPQHTELPARVVRLGELRNITLSVDAANSLDPKPGAKVSAVGLLVAGCLGEDRFALDDRTRVLGVDGTYLAIYEALAAWPIDLVLVELKALGSSVLAELERAIRRGWYTDPTTDEKVELRGPDGGRLRCKVEPALPGKEDKIQRAHGMLPTWNQGQMWLRDGADWLYPTVDESRRTVDEGHVGEVCSFPSSRRNDRVDAWSQFVAHHRGSTDTRSSWRAMRRLGTIAARR